MYFYSNYFSSIYTRKHVHDFGDPYVLSAITTSLFAVKLIYIYEWCFVVCSLPFSTIFP